MTYVYGLSDANVIWHITHVQPFFTSKPQIKHATNNNHRSLHIQLKYYVVLTLQPLIEPTCLGRHKHTTTL
jgi:hypothetical protein